MRSVFIGFFGDDCYFRIFTKSYLFCVCFMLFFVLICLEILFILSIFLPFIFLYFLYFCHSYFLPCVLLFTTFIFANHTFVTSIFAILTSSIPFKRFYSLLKIPYSDRQLGIPARQIYNIQFLLTTCGYFHSVEYGFSIWKFLFNVYFTCCGKVNENSISSDTSSFPPNYVSWANTGELQRNFVSATLKQLRAPDYFKFEIVIWW